LRTTIASTAIYAIKGNDVNDFVNLQPLIGVFTENPALLNGIAYLVVASILLAFVLKTRKVRPEDLPAEQLALVVPLALLPVYHRYPDLFLLIGAMPLCLVFYHERRYRLLAGLSGIIALLSIPLQTMAALVFRQTVQNDSAADLIRFVSLFRHQQLLLVTLALLVIFSTSGVPGRDFVARVYRLRGEQIPSIGKVEEKTPPQET
jgi:hypothetical protein